MTPEQEKIRTDIFENYQGIKDVYIRRMMIDYDRYYEANIVLRNLKDKMIGLKVLDFGCSVGDYGILLAKNGAKSTFYDFKIYIDFVKYRCELDKLECEFINVEDGLKSFEYDLIIFGEVLDHLESPIDILMQCIWAKVKYLWTTSYPFIPDNESGDARFNKSGHLKGAKEQQKEFRRIIMENYKIIDNPEGGLYLWEIKQSK